MEMAYNPNLVPIDWDASLEAPQEEKEEEEDSDLL